MNTAYEVVITREGGDWLADIPSVPGAHTFARTLPALMKAVREVIVLMDDDNPELEPDDITIIPHYDIPDIDVSLARDVAIRRHDLAIAEANLAAETVKLAGVLSERYSVRDTAELLGISPGRVSQLTNS